MPRKKKVETLSDEVVVEKPADYEVPDAGSVVMDAESFDESRVPKGCRVGRFWASGVQKVTLSR